MLEASSRTKDGRKQITLRCECELSEALKKAAKKEHIKINQLITLIIWHWVNEFLHAHPQIL